MLSRFLVAILLVVSMPVMASIPLPEVDVRRVDTAGEQVFVVEASGTVKASPAAVWKVLTDYEAMPEFVPDLKKNKVNKKCTTKTNL